MIYLGIDDTDVAGSPGTKRLARELVHDLFPAYAAVVAVRHQLLFDPRVPYTSKNSSASLAVEPAAGGSLDDLAGRVRNWLGDRFVAGSDPGICLARSVPPEVVAFGHRCQQAVVCQDDARRLAEAHGIFCQPLGGSGDGVIGALAAIGLLAEGDDGRVVQIAQYPDDLSGPQPIRALQARGVETRRADTGEPVSDGMVDVGKHLRPNYRGRRIVLLVEPCTNASISWHAVRLP